MMCQVTKLKQERVEGEGQLKRAKQELQTAQVELNKSASYYREAKSQIQMLSKEKGKRGREGDMEGMRKESGREERWKKGARLSDG